MNLSNMTDEQRDKVRAATKELREQHSAAHTGLAYMYGAFDMMTYEQYREWQKRLNTAYRMRFDELKQITLS